MAFIFLIVDEKTKLLFSITLISKERRSISLLSSSLVIFKTPALIINDYVFSCVYAVYSICVLSNFPYATTHLSLSVFVSTATGVKHSFVLHSKDKYVVISASNENIHHDQAWWRYKIILSYAVESIWSINDQHE